MKETRIPFLPFSHKRARLISRHYLGWGEKVTRLFHSLDRQMEHARIDFEPREWGALALFSFATYFSFVACLMFVIMLRTGVALPMAIGISFISGVAVGFMVFFIQMMYPKVFVSRRVKGLEKNLPYALHHMLIHIRSGVPLFSALVSVSKAGHGTLSTEFQRAIVEINTGKSEVSALEAMARENPSIYFRRILWQVVNAMKSGADVGMTLKEIVDNLTAEQKTSIKKYGAELNPLALFYMILVVIFPTLGIIFILVLFSFVGNIAMDIRVILIGILVFIVMVQFIFIGMIKAKRPLGV
jgi:pilus assembly protein TadC